MNETPESSVCATLYLHGIGQQRFLFVYGIKGKYEFRWSDQHQKLCREYASPAVFVAEELDMRRNTKNQYAICTLMGSPHPVTCAGDALATLIASGRSIGSPARRAALAAIVERAQAAIAIIDAPLADEETAAPPVAAVPEQAPPSSVEQGIPPELRTPWKDSATGVPLDLPPAATTGEVMPLASRGQHAQAELMQAEIVSVRALAKGLAISLMRPAGHPVGGPKSRGELVADILAAERQLAA